MRKIGDEWGIEQCEAVFRKRISGDFMDLSNAVWRSAIVARFVLGESVLDLACGAGQLANFIDEKEYLGVDFSPSQLWRARHDNKNPNAVFVAGNVNEWAPTHRFDTVVMGEILEHLEQPGNLARNAIGWARKRVIATIPENLPGGGHCWGDITRQDVLAIFGTGGVPDHALIVHRFLAAKGHWRWLVIRDIDSYQPDMEYIDDVTKYWGPIT